MHVYLLIKNDCSRTRAAIKKDLGTVIIVFSCEIKDYIYQISRNTHTVLVCIYIGYTGACITS